MGWSRWWTTRDLTVLTDVVPAFPYTSPATKSVAVRLIHNRSHHLNKPVKLNRYGNARFRHDTAWVTQTGNSAELVWFNAKFTRWGVCVCVCMGEQTHLLVYGGMLNCVCGGCGTTWWALAARLKYTPLQRVGVLLGKRPTGPPDRHRTQLAFGTFTFCFGQQAVFWCSTIFVKNKQGDYCLSIETVQARRGMPSETLTRTRTLLDGDILGGSHWQSVEFEYNENTDKKSNHMTSPTPYHSALHLYLARWHISLLCFPLWWHTMPAKC